MRRCRLVQGRHVLLLDDILDSGNTLAAISETIRLEAGPLSVKSCVLLRKMKKRILSIEADYVGFDIEDEFVVGYGLDYQERYRNLPLHRRSENLRVLIQIQYFAQLRELRGPDSIELAEGTTVEGLLLKSLSTNARPGGLEQASFDRRGNRVGPAGLRGSARGYDFVDAAGSRRVNRNCGLAWLVPEVPETETDAEIFAAQELDDSLKVVSLFAGHTDLAILDLALNLGIQRLNRFDDLFGLVALQALFDVNFLTRVSER